MDNEQGKEWSVTEQTMILQKKPASTFFCFCYIFINDFNNKVLFYFRMKKGENFQFFIAEVKFHDILSHFFHLFVGKRRMTLVWPNSQVVDDDVGVAAGSFFNGLHVWSAFSMQGRSYNRGWNTPTRNFCTKINCKSVTSFFHGEIKILFSPKRFFFRSLRSSSVKDKHNGSTFRRTKASEASHQQESRRWHISFRCDVEAGNCTPHLHQHYPVLQWTMDIAYPSYRVQS